MASPSPFGCNQRNSLFGGKGKGTPNSKPEPVTLIASKTQVITAIIPFSTPKAAAIRQHMHSNVLHDGQRIFYYRQQNGWTNIALTSTETSPKVTCDPVTTLKIAWREFNSCPFVSPLEIKWEGSNEVLGFDDIDGMETTFDKLPEETDAPNDGPQKTDAEVLFAKLGELEKKVSDVDTKIAYLVNASDKINKLLDQVNEEVGRIPTHPPGTPEPADKTGEPGGSSDPVTVPTKRSRKK
jgi:hypothetical protein